MEAHDVAVTILGARGSVPVSGADYARWGGATTCALFRAGGRFVILDAGTGLLSLPEEAMRASSLPVLLTHSHVDHLLGLPLCPYVMRKDKRLELYAAPREGLDARGQLQRLLSPPLWPVGADCLPASIRFHDLPEALDLDGIEVFSTEGEHPGGVSIFRLEAEGRRVVFASDCTLSDALLPRLTEFARGCDLLLCDGQYTQDEWADRASFGHSCWTQTARFAQACGAKRLRVVHHDPFRTDGQLSRMAEALRQYGGDFDFAREGECIRL